MTRIPTSWLTKVPMRRVHWHWTAGAYTPNSIDREHYHFLIDGDGKWHRGVDVALNSGSLKSGYAAHTLNANTDAIGVSLCCMAGAKESPFNPGKYPMKREQVISLIEGTRELCDAYSIPVTRKTTLSHAEVQPTLGITQRGKWDFTRLTPDSDLVGALKVGDYLRGEVEKLSTKPVEIGEPFPAGAWLRATVTTFAYSKPVADRQTGTVPEGLLVKLESEQDGWVRVSTPAGYTVWAQRDRFALVSGPKPTGPTEPSAMRQYIEDLRTLADKMEAEIGQ